MSDFPFEKMDPSDLSNVTLPGKEGTERSRRGDTFRTDSGAEEEKKTLEIPPLFQPEAGQNAGEAGQTGQNAGKEAVRNTEPAASSEDEGIRNTGSAASSEDEGIRNTGSAASSIEEKIPDTEMPARGAAASEPGADTSAPEASDAEKLPVTGEKSPEEDSPAAEAAAPEGNYSAGKAGAETANAGKKEGKSGGKAFAREESGKVTEKPAAPKKLSRRGALWITRGLIAAIVVVAALLGFYAVRHWRYHGYRVIGTQSVDSAISSTYYQYNENVLRLGVDRAVCYGKDRKPVWEVSYSMQNPKAVFSGNTAAIYDQSGTNIEICSEEGEIGSIQTELPITGATVSGQGNVAVILGDRNNTWIRYYGKDGTEIAAISTSMNDPGYPMGLALSPNGELLGISYLSYSDNVMKTRLNFYNFGTGGQNQLDNIVSTFTAEGTITPEVAFLDEKTAVAFQDNGFTIYTGGSIPEKKKEQSVPGQIVSVFYSSKYIGLMLRSSGSDTSFTLKVYNLDGDEILSKGIDFIYEKAEFSGEQVSLYNREQMQVYNLDGDLKFDGSYDGIPQKIMALDTRQYAVADESGLTWIRLR